MQHRYAPGDTVEYRPVWGTAAPTVAKITDTGEKNDKPLYGLDNGHWCYEYQVVRRVD